MKSFTTYLALAMLVSTSPIIVTPAIAQQGCPPGLAKKSNGCNPPGQLRQQIITQRVQSQRPARTPDEPSIGDVIPQNQLAYLYNYDRIYWESLPNLSGNLAYAAYEGNVVVIDEYSRTILNVVAPLIE